MASTLAHRINNIAAIVALFAGVITVTMLHFGMTQRMPEAHAAGDPQLNKEIAQERASCKRWGRQAGTEKFAACIADLKEIRVRHDNRRVNDPGNRRDGLTVIF